MPAPTTRRRPVPLAGLAAAGVVGFAVLGAAFRGALPTTQRLNTVEFPTPVVTPTAPPSMPGNSQEGEAFTQPPAAEIWEAPAWLREAGIVILVLLLALAVVLVARYLLARRPEQRAAWAPGLTGERGDVLEDLEAGLERASEALQRQLPARDAVIAAWVELEQVGAVHGAARSASQTATEYTVALLEGTGADADSLESLRQVYLRARFSSRPVTAQDVDVAAASLERLREAWAQSKPVIDPVAAVDDDAAGDDAPFVWGDEPPADDAPPTERER